MDVCHVTEIKKVIVKDLFEWGFKLSTSKSPFIMFANK